MSRRKMKLSQKERLAFVGRILRNEVNLSSLAKEAKVSRETIRRWISLYENERPTDLVATLKKSYSKKLKQKVVNDYLRGKTASYRLPQNMVFAIKVN